MLRWITSRRENRRPVCAPRAGVRRLSIERLEDRDVPSSVLVNYDVTQNWGSGFQAQVSIVNQATTPMQDWTLAFDYAAGISSLWDGKVVSHTGNRYVVTNAGWNSTLAAGGSVSFGFVASGPTTAPTNFTLNGSPLGGSTPPAVPSLTVGDVSISEPASGSANATFTLTLSAPSTSPVTVKYATANGSAVSGSDYTAASGTVTFAAGQTSQTVSVPVLADNVAEASETFTLNLSSPSGATISKATATATILDTPPMVTPPPSSSSGGATFKMDSDWGSGFTGTITVTNTGMTALNNWKLEFDFAGQINSLWNGKIVSKTGNHYVVQGDTWNTSLTAAASTSFGFNGSPGGGAAVPTNMVLTGTGSSPSGGTSPAPTSTGLAVWPSHVFAPYVDMAGWPTPDLVSYTKNQGIKFFNLAFVVADTATNIPSWGGFTEYAVNGGAFDTQMRTAIAGVRALGGDVAVSFGGANGMELAVAITDVNKLVTAYKSVIDAYGLTHIDFDIEGGAAADRASIDRRSQAIAILQQQATAAGKTLTVSFTLPVLPTGLTPDGVYILQSAVRYGVKVSLVNIMAMDYGDSAAPNPAGQMGEYAIQAATSLQAQLQTVYPSMSSAQLWSMVGITPMIGRNDVVTEVFDQTDARQLLAFAQQKGIGMLSMWSLTRDRQDPAGAIGYVNSTSSSLVQTPFEFSGIFGAFTG